MSAAVRLVARSKSKNGSSVKRRRIRLGICVTPKSPEMIALDAATDRRAIEWDEREVLPSLRNHKFLKVAAEGLAGI